MSRRARVSRSDVSAPTSDDTIWVTITAILPGQQPRAGHLHTENRALAWTHPQTFTCARRGIATPLRAHGVTMQHARTRPHITRFQNTSRATSEQARYRRCPHRHWPSPSPLPLPSTSTSSHPPFPTHRRRGWRTSSPPGTTSLGTSSHSFATASARPLALPRCGHSPHCWTSSAAKGCKQRDTRKEGSTKGFPEGFNASVVWRE